MMLVMQPRDNAIRFTTKKRLLGSGYRLTTARDAERPAPTYIDAGHQVAKWLAERTGGIAQSSMFEAFGNRPMTAHVLGGAVIGAGPATGVVDTNLQVFGYQNMVLVPMAVTFCVGLGADSASALASHENALLRAWQTSP